MRDEDGYYIENEETEEEYTETVVLPSELTHPVEERRNIMRVRKI